LQSLAAPLLRASKCSANKNQNQKGKSMKRSLCIILLFAGTSAAGTIPSVPLIDIDPQQEVDRNRAGVLPTTDESWGWAFTIEPRYRALVTHLAWHDTDGNGLSHPHAVGIWRNTLSTTFFPAYTPYWPHVSVNELVAEAVIPAGTTGDLIGPWRLVPIEPVRLESGQYQIVGENHAGSNDDLIFWASNSPGIAAGIRLGGMSEGQQAFGPIPWGGWLPGRSPFELFDNTTFSVPGGILGPMLFVQIIPEPTSSVPIVIGCAVCCLLRRRQARCPSGNVRRAWGVRPMRCTIVDALAARPLEIFF
jgi:hypothetical protein